MQTSKAAVYFCALALAGCAAILGPPEYVQIGDAAQALAKCDAVAYACKADGGAAKDCYEAYEACKKDAGL